MSDRHDDLMHALYRGDTPAWLPEPARVLFVRESIRRRCALGQVLQRHFRCTWLLAQAYHPEFAADVSAGWLATCTRARTALAGVFLAADRVLAGRHELAPARDLLRYEALAIDIPGCELVPDHPATQRTCAVRGEGWEVFSFEYAVTAFHPRLVLYAGAGAPASLVRAVELTRSPCLVARRRTARGWHVDPVLEPTTTSELTGAHP